MSSSAVSGLAGIGFLLRNMEANVLGSKGKKRRLLVVDQFRDATWISVE